MREGKSRTKTAGKPSRGNEYRREQKRKKNKARFFRHAGLLGRENPREKTRRDGSNREPPPLILPLAFTVPHRSPLRFPLFRYIFKLSQRTRVACSSRGSYGTILAGVAFPWASREFNGQTIDTWGRGRKGSETIGTTTPTLINSFRLHLSKLVDFWEDMNRLSI